MVREIVRTKRDDRSMAALGRICQELGAAEPALAGQLGHFEGWFQTTEALLRAARAEGSMDPTIDPERAAWFAVTAFVGADFVADLRDDEFEPQVDAYLDFTFRALGIER